MAVELVHPEIRAAIRTRIQSVVKAQSGALSLTSAGSVITRASGSFITNGFGVGDEVMVAGFTPVTPNGRAMISAVTALTMTLDRTLGTASAAAGTITAGTPQGRHWEGFSYAPSVGQPFFVENMLTPDSSVRALGSDGLIEHRIEGVFTLVYPAGQGTKPIESMAGAFLKHFKPGTGLTYGTTTGIVFGVRRASGLVQQPDWLRLVITASITAYTVN